MSILIIHGCKCLKYSAMNLEIQLNTYTLQDLNNLACFQRFSHNCSLNIVKHGFLITTLICNNALGFVHVLS